MKKIKLTEEDLTDIISQVISEQYYGGGIIEKGDVPCDIWCKRKVAMRRSRGDVVKMIQHLLARGCGDYGPYGGDYYGGGMNRGCRDNWTSCDGKFEKETKKAVEEFQGNFSGLKVDGKVGAKTLAALCGVCVSPGLPGLTTGFNLCVDCDCTEEIEKIDVEENGIEDVLEIIGDVDIDDWDKDGRLQIGDGVKNCNRIKACLYYANSKKGEKWYYFTRCMQGKFPNLDRRYQ
tara:strand:- start:414 stop:1112 length:699 start_codon:yes stop_codon:yes gene_type:complete